MYRRASLWVVVVASVVASTGWLAWAQVVVPPGRVATFDGQGANAWAGNIRASDEELVALLEEGMQAIADVQGPRRPAGEI